MSLRSTFLLSLLVLLAGCAQPAEDEEEGSSEGAITGTSRGGTRIVNTGGIGVWVKSGPTSASARIIAIPEGMAVTVQCRTLGESIRGNASWDYLPKYKGYVADYYVSKSGGSFPSCDGELDEKDPALAGPSPPASATVSAGTGDVAGVIAEARSWVGTHDDASNCNPFSTALGYSCEAWCSDFLVYVWRKNGMRTEGITPYAGSFLSYGTANGTLKSRDSADVAPGDAVVWARTATDAAHVGMVTEVLAGNALRVINGNWGDAVQEVTTTRSSLVSGYGIAGFVSPVRQ